MADLDDFFAKKDRKKSKGKKFTTTEEIAKKLEETGKKSEKTKKDKPIIQSSINVQENDDEDEWKNFEEEKKDYTGLKIQNLTLEESSDSENNDGESERIMEDNGSGEIVPKRKGPWKVIEAEQTPEENSTNKTSNVLFHSFMKSGTGTPTVQSYVPPHLRKQKLPTRDRPTRSKPGAPDINNQEFFPTLSAAKNEEMRISNPVSGNFRKQDGAFEEVRNSRSHSNRSDPNQRQQNLQIGNKFGALESEHS
ncbi:UNVERIFIED_CONTAM: hypothetical protein PYX00_010319 [Menopon gallinae]|uniref:CDV3 homolog n=1 Tax=Menopon gallinae TaxID=328185 RepID=A0AAW2HEZ5_9NEOP